VSPLSPIYYVYRSSSAVRLVCVRLGFDLFGIGVEIEIEIEIETYDSDSDFGYSAQQ